MNLQCGSWTGAATHLIRLKHGVFLKKKQFFIFLRSIKSWVLGKRLNVFEPFPVAMTFTWGKPLPVSGVVSTSHLWGPIWGLRIRSCQDGDRIYNAAGTSHLSTRLSPTTRTLRHTLIVKLLWLVVSCLWSSSSSPLGKRFKRKSTGKSGWWKMKDVFSVRKLLSEPCKHCLLAWLLLPSIILTCDIAIFIHKLDMGQNLRDGTMGCVDVIKPPIFLWWPLWPKPCHECCFQLRS